MPIDLKVYDNGDHTALVWLPTGGRIANCLGFTVRRLLTRNGSNTEDFLSGFVGFSDDQKFDKAAPWKFALQRYMWWDYHVSPGDVVQYSVVPVVGTNKDSIKLAPGDASALTPPMTITGQSTPKVSAYFNKGIVSAQWVSRALATLGPKPKIADIISQPGNALRNALSGLLRPQILALLKEAKDSGGEVFAAMYELNDPELIDGLKALGKKCHLILANGAFKPPDNDENKKVRDQLRDVVDLHDRLVANGHFAHNKFLVFCDSGGNPQRVLSGSTNWSMTGLCTQANNGIIVDDPALAANFLAEWKLLRDAKNGYPDTLAEANSKASSFDIDGGRITQWFAPTKQGQDLDFARKLISSAEEGILFLFFNPGKFVAADQPESKWTLLQNIIFRHHQGTANYNPNLYIRGVVNQGIEGLTNDTVEQAIHDPEPPVTLFSGGKTPPQRLGYESMVPKNIKDVFHNWKQEILGAGVHIHSKVVVLDPFGKNPVVMTGSHNLGFKASHANDDNLMIIEGNAPLAASYAVNIIATYQAYRWNAYVEAHRNDPKVFHALAGDDSWQDGHLKGDELSEIKFWLGSRQTLAATANVPPVVPTSGDSPAPTATATGPRPVEQAPVARTRPVKRVAMKKKSVVKKKSAKKKKTVKKTAKKKTVKKKATAKKAGKSKR